MHYRISVFVYFIIFTPTLFEVNEKINCTFEDGFCYWTQHIIDYNEWERAKGPTYPSTSGPDFDHTFKNLSGKKYRVQKQLLLLVSILIYFGDNRSILYSFFCLN